MYVMELITESGEYLEPFETMEYHVFQTYIDFDTANVEDAIYEKISEYLAENNGTLVMEDINTPNYKAPNAPARIIFETELDAIAWKLKWSGI